MPPPSPALPTWPPPGCQQCCAADYFYVGKTLTYHHENWDNQGARYVIDFTGTWNGSGFVGERTIVDWYQWPLGSRCSLDMGGFPFDPVTATVSVGVACRTDLSELWYYLTGGVTTPSAPFTEIINPCYGNGSTYGCTDHTWGTRTSSCLAFNGDIQSCSECFDDPACGGYPYQSFAMRDIYTASIG